MTDTTLTDDQAAHLGRLVDVYPEAREPVSYTHLTLPTIYSV